MLDISHNPAEGLVVLALDEGAAPRDALYAAAFAFIDRCWVHLDRVAGGRVEVALRSKTAGADVEALGAELRDGLLAEAWRRKAVDEGRAVLEGVATRAFGAPAAEAEVGSLDDLLAADGGAFDDPLGIAMSWEDKYAKKDQGGAT
jgi:hypothetical protein